MKRSICRAAAIVSAILLFVYLALLLSVNSVRFQNWLLAEIATRTGYEITAREIALDPLLRLSLTEVRSSSKDRFELQAQRIVVVPSVATLFFQRIRRLQIDKPVLRLNLQGFFTGPRQEPPGIAIRHLVVEDGTLVLTAGAGKEIDFRSMAVRADNVNLAAGIDFYLRAAVPRLDGIASIAIQAGRDATEAIIRLEQSGGRGIANPGKIRPALETKVRLTRAEEGLIQVKADATLNAMRIGNGSFSGNAGASAEIKPGSKEAVFDVTAAATEWPEKLPFLPARLPKGKTTLSLRGDYRLGAGDLNIRSMELQSPLGDATGTGRFAFRPAAAWKNVQVKLRKVAVENLKPLLPSPMNTAASGGILEADLTIDGPWDSPSLEGIARAVGVSFRDEQFAFSDLNIETPVHWTGDVFRADAIRLSGRKLIVRRINEIAISAESVAIAGKLEKKRDEAPKVAATARIQQGAFSSADGSKVGENLALQARFDSTGMTFGDGPLLAGVTIEQGEVLWGRFYANLKSQRPTFEFDGEYLRNGDLLRVRRANLALASVGHLTIQGEVHEISKKPVMRVEIKSDDIQSAGLYDFFIRETLKRSYPVLDRVAVAGRLALSAQISGVPDKWDVDGVITLRGGNLLAESGHWNIRGIEISLPFGVGYPAAVETTPANAATGTLTVESAKFGKEVIGTIRSPVSLHNNVLRIHQPIRVPVYGGSLEISKLVWKDIISAPQAFSLSAEATNLQLEKLTEALDWYRFGGTFSGSIPKIEWTGGSLRSEGQIDIAVFGGHVGMRNLEIEAPFSAVPSIKLDARLQNIQLEQASETFAFGRISGVLEGTVGNLIVTAGQPSSFVADIHSVEQGGVSQRISVESLNKITVLTSGENAGALYSGLAGLFDSFRYSKLGFKAVLKNDKLTLRGVESRDGKEYLVVGSLIPPSVNVISHTQDIAFLELLRRLEQVQKSDAPQKTAP